MGNRACHAVSETCIEARGELGGEVNVSHRCPGREVGVLGRKVGHRSGMGCGLGCVRAGAGEMAGKVYSVEDYLEYGK